MALLLPFIGITPTTHPLEDAPPPLCSSTYVVRSLARSLGHWHSRPCVDDDEKQLAGGGGGGGDEAAFHATLFPFLPACLPVRIAEGKNKSYRQAPAIDCSCERRQSVDLPSDLFLGRRRYHQYPDPRPRPAELPLSSFPFRSEYANPRSRPLAAVGDSTGLSGTISGT